MINSVVAEHFEPFIAGMLTLVASLVVLWILDWQLTSVLFATLFLSFVVTIPIATKLNALSKKTQEQEANFLSFITERFSQIRLIKSACAEGETIGKSKANLDLLYSLGIRSVKIGAVMAPISGITIASTLIVILAFGASRVSEGAITMGTLIAFILYLFNIVFPVIQFTFFIAALNKAAGAAERVGALLDEPREQDNKADNHPIKSQLDGRGDINFTDISFSYGEKALF